MPAPYWGYISPEKQRLEEDLLRAQAATMRRGTGSTVALEIAREQIAAQERAREAEAERPQYFTSGGSLLSVSPQGKVTEAWQAPTPPITVGVGQALVDPTTGEPLYAPPRITATPTELIVTDTPTGDILNRIPITQLPRDAAFFVDKYGKITALDPQSGEVISEVGAPQARVLMQREAREREEDLQLRTRAEDRAWKAMEISEEMAVMANITEKQRIEINAETVRMGFDVKREGFVVNERIMDKANVSTESIAKLNVATTQRGQDLTYELGVSDQELREILGTGQLKLAIRAEDRAWQAMTIGREIAEATGIREEKLANLDAAVKREGFAVTTYGIEVSKEMAIMTDISETERTKLNIEVKKRGQDLQHELGISTIELQEMLGTGQLKVAVSAEGRAWEAMYIDKDLMEAAGAREENRDALNVILKREGFAVTTYGIEVSADQAERAQIAETARTIINAGVRTRGQDLQFELGVSTLELQEMLGVGELVAKERTEKRLWAQMYISKGIADRANITEELRIKVNAILTRENYDILRDSQAIQERIAVMQDVTSKEKTDILAGLEERRLRIESTRVDADIERGKFMQIGDVIVRRNEDESIEIMFEMPADQYPLTPIKVGDDKSGYRVGLIDPYKGTIDWFDALPGGAAGAEEAKMHLELLDMARKIVDPGNTFLTTVDPEVKANIYRQTMALYSDFLQAPAPGGLGYTAEQAARFTTPMELWRAMTDTTLTFGGETAEPTAELFGEYTRGRTYPEAVPLTTPPVTPPVTVAEPTAAKKELTLPEWVSVFKSQGSGDAIKYLQQYMKDNDLWDGVVDGVWSVDLERKFKVAYNRGYLKLGMRSE